MREDEFSERKQMMLSGDLIKRNAVLRNRHAGRRCFLVGNGSSLLKQDLHPLKDEITLVGNRFFNHPIVNEWQPTYYCLADPAYFDREDLISEFYPALRQRIQYSTFVVSVAGAPLVNERKVLPPDQTYYVQFGAELTHQEVFWVELTETIPAVMNVMQLAMMTALYMGCNPIYLMGMEHDWLANWVCKDAWKQHFYQDGPIEKEMFNETYRYRQELECQLRLWYGYEHLLAFLQRSGRMIINATAGGVLDVFPRQKYEDVLRDKRPVPGEGPYSPCSSPMAILRDRAFQLSAKADEFLRQGEFEKALRRLDEAMYAYPALTGLQRQRAQCLAKLGRKGEAAAAARAERLLAGAGAPSDV